MNREEFMKQLEKLLQGISEEERMDALQYYEDYFEDAGPDREAEVIRELGSPEHVAKIICEDMNTNQQWSQWQSKEATNTQGFQSGGRDEWYNGKSNSNTAVPPEYSYQGNENKKSVSIVALVILIVTLPITLPILGSILAAVVSLICGVFGCIFGFFIGGAALLIAAMVLFVTGIAGVGFVLLGIGVLLLGLAFLLLPLGVWICAKAIPSIYRFIKNGVMKLLEKGETML